MNKPVLCKIQTKLSVPCCKLILAILATRWFHSSSLFPTNALLNSTLSGTELNTSRTFACFLLTMLNEVGYWDCSGWFSNQVSSQNLIWLPFFNLKIDKLKKVSFHETSKNESLKLFSEPVTRLHL
jgi:hypothetical protein